jgi:hypothetical protein
MDLFAYQSAKTHRVRDSQSAIPLVRTRDKHKSIIDTAPFDFLPEARMIAEKRRDSTTIVRRMTNILARNQLSLTCANVSLKAHNRPATVRINE